MGRRVNIVRCAFETPRDCPRVFQEVLVRSTKEPRNRRAVWVCPKCGARLVSRNLCHSCGRFTLEDLFAKATPDVRSLAKRFVKMLNSLGDVQVIPQKTRLVCVARVRFVGLYPRKGGLRVGFALRRRLRSRRIIKTADYGPKWRGHFIDIRATEDLDGELRAWLQEAHDTVGVQRDASVRRRASRPPTK
jgi:hypothetical protein